MKSFHNFLLRRDDITRKLKFQNIQGQELQLLFSDNKNKFKKNGNYWVFSLICHYVTFYVFV